MIKIKAQQVVIATFTPEIPKKEDVHGTKYSITLGLSPKDHRGLIERLVKLSSKLIGSSVDAAATLLGNEHDRKPSTMSGLIYIDCWGDDQSFSGMLVNGQIFPHEQDELPRNIVLTDCDVMLSCRLMTKKDNSVVLAWTAHIIDVSGMTPEHAEKKEDKKR